MVSERTFTFSTGQLLTTVEALAALAMASPDPSTAMSVLEIVSPEAARSVRESLAKRDARRERAHA